MMHEKNGEKKRKKLGAKSCFIGQPGSGGLFKHNRVCPLSKNLWITRPEQLSRVHTEGKGGKKDHWSISNIAWRRLRGDLIAL